MSEEIKETYLKLPNVTVGDLQDVVDFMEDNDIEYVEFYEKDLKQQIEDLQQKVEQLEKDKSYANWYAVKKEKEVEQLENIRKEAIEYVYKHIQEYDADGTFTNLDEFDFIASPQVLLDILNKGSENDVKKDNTNSN